MNCRINEEKVFPSPKVATLLERGFVEARLHTDGETNIERILELQEELAQSYATPFYLAVDPKSKRPVGETLAGETKPDAFRAFLLEAVDDAGEKVGRLDGR